MLETRRCFARTEGLTVFEVVSSDGCLIKEGTITRERKLLIMDCFEKLCFENIF